MKKLVLLVILFIVCMFARNSNSAEKFLPPFDMCTVKRVIDGDTFEANCRYRGKGVKIRVLGVDTYESRENSHLSKQLSGNITAEEAIVRGKFATRCGERFLKDTAVVVVFTDRRYDVYNRLLGDVFVVVGSKKFIRYTRLLHKYCEQGIYK